MASLLAMCAEGFGRRCAVAASIMNSMARVLYHAPYENQMRVLCVIVNNNQQQQLLFDGGHRKPPLSGGISNIGLLVIIERDANADAAALQIKMACLSESGSVPS